MFGSFFVDNTTQIFSLFQLFPHQKLLLALKYLIKPHLSAFFLPLMKKHGDYSLHLLVNDVSWTSFLHKLQQQPLYVQ